MDLHPDIPLADKDDEKKEPSQHVAGIQNPEGYLDILAGLAGLIVMVVDKEMNSLNGPQNAKDQEQFQVKDLKYRNTGYLIINVNKFCSCQWWSLLPQSTCPCSQTDL